MNATISRGRMLAAVVTAVCGVAWSGGTVAEAAPLAQAPATVSVYPALGSVAGCDVLEVEIRISDVTGLYGADVRLSFDPDVLQVVDADPGTSGVQVEAGGMLSPPLIMARNVADNDVGTVWYAATQVNPTLPVDGSGVLAAVQFRARSPGSTPISVAYERLGDRDGEEIPAIAEDASVQSLAPGCITVWPIDPVIDACDDIEVEIRIGNVPDLYGADVRLTFDPSIVEVVDWDGPEPGVQLEIGDLLAPPLLVTRNVADNAVGTIWFAATQLNPTPPVTGDGVLAIVHLRAVGAGSAALAFSYTKLGNRDGEEIAATATGGTVSAVAPSAPVLSISKLDPVTARLSWSGVPGIGAYHLYRDSYAYFVPGGTPHATTAAVQYDDIGALGSSAVNYFYVVRSACANGFESPISNRVGEFDFELFPGTAVPFLRKYNLIGYPLHVSAIPHADALAAYIDPGSSVYQVVRYDNALQSVNYWLPSLGVATNFPMSVGEPYYAHLDHTGPSLVTFAGDVPALGTVTFPLNRPAPLASCRYNYLTVPLDRIDLTTSDGLAADIGGVYIVLRYNSALQMVEYRVPGLGIGPNFAVRVGYPYIICVDSTAPAVWP